MCLEMMWRFGIWTGTLGLRCLSPAGGNAHQQMGLKLQGELVQECLGGRRSLFFPLQIPIPVLEISSSQHPVKAGLSDAFMILNPSPDVPGETPVAHRDPWTGLDSAQIEPGWWGRGQWQEVVGGWGELSGN